ncbi:DUF1330 domain-containing protein [Phenylobacterium sp.]|jgi:uncharacterized protein (DUF1330 family)|uniref:DUF1330 domain-containing protein n=1 Tax=Phenylobacterium sp. TaxID=1871053 RepID=UPI002F93FAE4
MTAYIVAQLTIHDRERYARYAAAFLPTLKPFGGRLLAADEAPELMEGAWDHEKLNVIAFPDKAAARAWAASAAYQAIAPDRLAASDAVVLLVEGFG